MRSGVQYRPIEMTFGDGHAGCVGHGRKTRPKLVRSMPLRRQASLTLPSDSASCGQFTQDTPIHPAEVGRLNVIQEGAHLRITRDLPNLENRVQIAVGRPPLFKR